MVGRGGFEPPQSRDGRFTVCSLQPLGHRPIIKLYFDVRFLFFILLFRRSDWRILVKTQPCKKILNLFSAVLTPPVLLGHRPIIKLYFDVRFCRFNLPLTRFELVTSPLPRECATPTPQGQAVVLQYILVNYPNTKGVLLPYPSKNDT